MIDIINKRSCVDWTIIIINLFAEVVNKGNTVLEHCTLKNQFIKRIKNWELVLWNMDTICVLIAKLYFLCKNRKRFRFIMIILAYYLTQIHRFTTWLNLHQEISVLKIILFLTYYLSKRNKKIP